MVDAVHLESNLFFRTDIQNVLLAQNEQYIPRKAMI